MSVFLKRSLSLPEWISFCLMPCTAGMFWSWRRDSEWWSATEGWALAGLWACLHRSLALGLLWVSLGLDALLMADEASVPAQSSVLYFQERASDAAPWDAAWCLFVFRHSDSECGVLRSGVRTAAYNVGLTAENWCTQHCSLMSAYLKS